MHNCDIIHRDLKASNVLLTFLEYGWTPRVVDYECSIGVCGTGFFRALEILQACRDYSVSKKRELFTMASDAYSYGMLCYEILIGKLPFEDYGKSDFDHVLVGERPSLPNHVDGWLQDLLRWCWESNPLSRPSFREILEVFLANSKTFRKFDAISKEKEAERLKCMISYERGWVLE